MPKIQFEGKVLEGTEEQLTEFINELPDVESSSVSKPETKSRINSLNPLGMNPASGFVGADPRDVGKGAMQTASGLVEGFTGGMLKPERFSEELEGNMAGKIAGFVGGPGKLIRGVTAPLQAAKSAIPAARMIGPVVRGAAEGALGGLAFPSDDLDSRISNAKTGAILGAVVEPAVTGITQAWQGFQKFKQAKQALKQLDNEKFSHKASPMAEAPHKLQLREQRLRKAEKKIITAQKSSMDEQMKGLSAQLNTEAQSQAQAIKEPTLNYMRKFKDEWGQQFDELLESADTAEQGLKISELQQIRQETIEELTELGIDPKGPAVQTMEKAVNSFRPSQIMKKVTEEGIDEAGMLTKKTIEVADEADDLIKNRDLVNVRRNVRGALSTQAKRGQYTEEDIAQAIFDRKLGEKLSTTLGDRFGQLNSEYKKFSDLSRFAYKNLRPKASEFDDIAGARIIKKVATGKATAGEEKAVRQLEEVTGIKFTGKASKTGSQIESLRNLKQSRMQEIKTKFSRRQAELSRMKRQAGTKNKEKLRKIEEEIRANKDIVDSLPFIKQAGPAITGTAIGATVGSSISFLMNRLLRGGRE